MSTCNHMGLITARQMQVRLRASPRGGSKGKPLVVWRGQAAGKGQHGLAVKVTGNRQHPRLHYLPFPKSTHILGRKFAKVGLCTQRIVAIGLPAGKRKGFRRENRYDVGLSARWRMAAFMFSASRLISLASKRGLPSTSPARQNNRR